ncbi:MAG: hypothetical protein LUE96_05740 [Lachnospiraceae bacterium]|nr:hypothetical protein [Lachnospiraceae bacterium]
MKKFMILVCALALTLCACASETPSEDGGSSVTLKKDGSVEIKMTEEFGSDYSEDGLKSLIDESVAAYGRQSGSAQISLESCEKDGAGQLVIEMTFDSSETYAGWKNYFLDYMYASELGMDSDIEIDTQGFFAGTISEAYAAGYSLDVTLAPVSDNSVQSVTKADLLSMGDKHIVILEREDEDETVTVNCYGEILYVGDGVTATEKKSAQVSAADGYAMIVFE